MRPIQQKLLHQGLPSKIPKPKPDLSKSDLVVAGSNFPSGLNTSKGSELTSKHQIKVCKNDSRDAQQPLAKISSIGNDTEILQSANQHNRLAILTFGHLPETEERQNSNRRQIPLNRINPDLIRDSFASISSAGAGVGATGFIKQPEPTRKDSIWTIQGAKKQISNHRKLILQTSKIQADSQECSAGTTPVKFDLKYDEPNKQIHKVGIPQASAEFEMQSPTSRHEDAPKQQSEYYEVRAQEVQIMTNPSFRGNQDQSALAKQGLEGTSQEDNCNNILNDLKMMSQIGASRSIDQDWDTPEKPTQLILSTVKPQSECNTTRASKEIVSNQELLAQQLNRYHQQQMGMSQEGQMMPRSAMIMKRNGEFRRKHMSLNTSGCSRQKQNNFMGSRISRDSKLLSDRVRDQFGSAMEATLSSDGGFPAKLEKNFFQSINKSHNKLCKNVGLVYNKITLEKIHQQKKHFTEAAIKNSFVPGQKVQNKLYNKLEQKVYKEKEIQEMNTRSFLKYLNRQQETLSLQEPLSPKTDDTHKEIYLRGQPLNKYRFRKEMPFSSTISGQTAREFSPKNKREKHYGISNYDFALKQKELDNVNPPQKQFFSSPEVPELDDSRSMKAAHHVSREKQVNTAKKMSLITLGENNYYYDKSSKSIHTDHQINNLLFSEFNENPLNEVEYKLRNSQLQKFDTKDSIMKKAEKRTKSALKTKKVTQNIKTDIISENNENGQDSQQPPMHVPSNRVRFKRNHEINKSVDSYCELDKQSKRTASQNQAQQTAERVILSKIVEENSPQRITFKEEEPLTFQLQKDIKIMNQVCQRLVTASDEYPTLYLEQSQDIELTPGVSLVYRFELQNVPNPLKFDIQYRGSIKPQQSNLEVFLSTIAKNPSYSNNEIKFMSKTLFFLQADKIGITKRSESTASQVQLFEDKYLYICLQSVTGCSITLTLRTILSRQHFNKLRLQQYRAAKEKVYLDAYNAFNMNDNYYREMIQIEEAKNQAALQHKKIIKEQGFGIYYPCEEKTIQRIQKHKQRMQTNMRNYMSITNFERKKSLFLKEKWIFLNKIKNMQFDEKRAEFRKMLYATNFIKNQKTVSILKDIMNIFKLHKFEIKKRNNAFFISLVLFMKYKRAIKKQGQLLNSRIEKKLCQILTFFGNTLNSTKEQEALDILKPFLKRWYECLQIQTKILQRGVFASKVVRRIENKYYIEKNRLLAMKTTIWTNEVNKLMALCSQKTGSEKLKVEEIIKKVIVVRHEHKYKDFVIELYIQRQFLQNKANFVWWWLQERERLLTLDSGYQISRKYMSYSQLLPKIKEKIKFIDEFLNKDIEKFQFVFKEKLQKSPKKGGKVAKKVNAKQAEDLVAINITSKILTQLAKQGIFTMPSFQLIEKDQINVVKELIIRAAHLDDDQIQSFTEIYKYMEPIEKNDY